MTFKITFKLDLPRHYVPMEKEKATNVNLFQNVFSGSIDMTVGTNSVFTKPVKNVNLLTFFKEMVRVLERDRKEYEVHYSSLEKPLKLTYEDAGICFSGRGISKKAGCITEIAFAEAVVIAVKDFVNKVVNWNPAFKKNPHISKLFEFIAAIENRNKSIIK